MAIGIKIGNNIGIGMWLCQIKISTGIAHIFLVDLVLVMVTEC